MKSIVLSLLTSLGILCGGVVHAVAPNKVSQAEDLYGKGVHAFFDGDYQLAVALLQQVETLGSEDPRPYFFLAIAQHRLKQDAEADATLRKAARLEWEGQAVRDYDVSGALRRIQGAERLFVEMYRKRAEVEWKKTEKKRREEKYAAAKKDERDILATLAQSFVGVAPFGARSVDPFRAAEADVAPERMIKVDDVVPVVTPRRLPETADDAATAPAPPAVKRDDKDEDPFAAPAATTPAKAESTDKKADDDDPFSDGGDKKKDDEKKDDEKKEEKKKESADDDDPFA